MLHQGLLPLFSTAQVLYHCVAVWLWLRLWLAVVGVGVYCPAGLWHCGDGHRMGRGHFSGGHLRDTSAAQQRKCPSAWGPSETKIVLKLLPNVAKRAFQHAPCDQRVVGACQPPAGTRTAMWALGEHCGAVWRGSTSDQATLDPFVGGFSATFSTPLAHNTLLSDGRPTYSLAASDRPQGPLRTCWAPWVLVLRHFTMLSSGKKLCPQQIVSTTERFEAKPQHQTPIYSTFCPI